MRTFILLFAIVALTASKPSTENAACNEMYAMVSAEIYVKRQLKSPSTADFQRQDKNRVYRRDGQWIYIAYVDSQNSFGAMMRTEFAVIMVCKGGNMELVEIIVD